MAKPECDSFENYFKLFFFLEVPSLQFHTVSAQALQWQLCQGYKISQKS